MAAEAVTSYVIEIHFVQPFEASTTEERHCLNLWRCTVDCCTRVPARSVLFLYLRGIYAVNSIFTQSEGRID